MKTKESEDYVFYEIANYFEIRKINWGEDEEIQKLAQEFWDQWDERDNKAEKLPEFHSEEKFKSWLWLAIPHFLEDKIRCLSLKVISQTMKRCLPNWDKDRIAEESEDANQNLWLDMPTKFQVYSTEKKFLPWLSTVARNHAIDHLRKYKFIHKNEILPDDEEPIEPKNDKRNPSYNCDYTLANVVKIFQELSYDNSEPLHTLETMDFISRIYIALELVAFGKNWKNALEKLEEEQKKYTQSYNFPEFLKLLFERGIESLACYISKENTIVLEKLYYTYLIRAHVLEEIGYSELANEMNQSKDKVKEETEKALALFQTILHSALEIDLRKYCSWRIAFKNTIRIAFKILGCDAEIDSIFKELSDAIDISQISLYENNVDMLLKKYWKECTCSMKSKEWKYCWAYSRMILEHYHQDNLDLETIFNSIYHAEQNKKDSIKIKDTCKNLSFKDFAEFQQWFKNLENRFKLILKKLGISLTYGSGYYLWKLAKKKKENKEGENDEKST